MKKKNEIKFYDRTTVFRLWDEDLQQYFKGVSVCRPEDEYDQGLGIKIARQKAVVKMRSWKVRACEDALKKIERLKQLEPEVLKQHEYWKDKAERAFAQLVTTLNEIK